METAVKKLYEAMFLIDSAEAAKDWDGVIELINKTLAKAEADVVSVRKWDERPLAYTIHRCSRGTYILAYFRVDGRKVREIERDVQLSERIIRVLILKADHLSEADIAKETPATRTYGQGPQASDLAPVTVKTAPSASPRGEQTEPSPAAEAAPAAERGGLAEGGPDTPAGPDRQ